MRNARRAALTPAQLSERTGLSISVVLCIQSDLREGLTVSIVAAMWEATIEQVLRIAENTTPEGAK